MSCHLGDCVFMYAAFNDASCLQVLLSHRAPYSVAFVAAQSHTSGLNIFLMLRARAISRSFIKDMLICCISVRGLQAWGLPAICFLFHCHERTYGRWQLSEPRIARILTSYGKITSSVPVGTPDCWRHPTHSRCTSISAYARAATLLQQQCPDGCILGEERTVGLR